MKKKKCFIIAEAGTSHGGDLKKGKELVHAAAESGADCIKFQLVYADEIIHPKTGTVPLPGGDVPLYETFRKLEQPPEFYASLRETAGNAGIGFLCTPFGIQSARILRELGVEMLKIASPELNYVPLLEEIAGCGMPIILSTGVSTPTLTRRSACCVPAAARARTSPCSTALPPIRRRKRSTTCCASRTLQLYSAFPRASPTTPSILFSSPPCRPPSARP